MDVSTNATPFVNANQLSIAYTQAIQAASIAEQKMAALLRTDAHRAEDQVQKAEMQTQADGVDQNTSQAGARQGRRRRAPAPARREAERGSDAIPAQAAGPVEAGAADPSPSPHRIDLVA
jgi:hypothetical protein